MNWDNSNNITLLREAKDEALKCMGGVLPALLDPFAGGGTIPLEAQRLGLKAFAHDLNPIAVLINKSMIEIAPRFNNHHPVNPDDLISKSKEMWNGTQGIAADVRYYGEWIKEHAFKEIGYLYPKARLSKELGGEEATIIAWIWARTTICPNPACGCEMPLASSYILSKKKGNEAWVEPVNEKGKIQFKVHLSKCPKDKESAKEGRSALFRCPICGETTTDEYVKMKGKEHALGSRLMAIIVDGPKGRTYLDPNEEQEKLAQVDMPEEYPSGKMPENPRWFSPPAFGMTEYAELFTNRQLKAMIVFSDLVVKARSEIENAAIASGMANDHIPLSEGGTGARAYSEAVGVYLAFGISRMANSNNSMCRWTVNKTQVIPVFSRQAIPMVWDFAENNVFNNAAGDISVALNNVSKAIEKFPSDVVEGTAVQHDAQSDSGLRNIMVSTDPPYYDNIGYADLSDFFYIWMRYCLKDVFPDLFSTMLVPKVDELIATPYRHDGNAAKAKEFFENGMLATCQQIYKYSRDDIPVSIYYAYKQSDSDDATETKASSGWETMLSAIIQAGFSITGTWPMRTEMANRAVASGTNALASSIVLVCRKRPEDAPQTTRRNLINILRRELRPALKKLQESNIAPVDLAQSAIGPGMGVFSRYRRVLEADGSPMTVRSALQVINEEIDLYFNEQVSDLDAMSRFCVDLYTQNAFNDIRFGDADILARAKGTSVAALSSHDVVYAKAGTVHLIERTELPEKIDANESCIWMLTQQLTQAMATGGIDACAKAVFMMYGSNAERAKDLAYRLYTIAEQKKWSNEAFAYNALVVTWPDIQSRAAMMQRETPEQLDMFSMGLLNQ